MRGGTEKLRLLALKVAIDQWPEIAYTLPIGAQINSWSCRELLGHSYRRYSTTRLR